MQRGAGTGRYAQERRRRLGDRRKVLDPEVGSDRRVRTGSFVPMVDWLFFCLEKGNWMSGKELAEQCRSRWSAGSVWAHVDYLVAEGVLVSTYSGQRVFLAPNPDMPAEARGLHRALLEQVAWLREVHRRIRGRKAAQQTG